MKNQTVNNRVPPDEEEIEEFHSLAGEVAQKVDGASALMQDLNNKIVSCDDKGEDDLLTKSGLGFFEVKNLIMLEYVTDLSLLLLMKSRGKKIKDAKAIERIVENRTVLEKMRPIEKKLKYQIDKYVKVAESGGEIRPEDPMHFKPNPSALAADDDFDGDSDENEDASAEDKSTTQLYRVPKHIPTICDDDAGSKQDIEREERAESKKRTLSKSILEDLRRQHLDTPEEEYHQMDTMKAKHVAILKERTRYEEEHFMRLPQMSKKEKHQLKKRSMTTMNNVGDEITHFGQNNFYNKSQDGKGEKRKHKGLSREGGKGKKKKFKIT